MRRALRNILIAIALGVVTTLTVAWGCAWLANAKPEFTEATTLSLADPTTRLMRGSISWRRVRGRGMYALVAQTNFKPNVMDVRSAESILDRVDDRERERVIHAIQSSVGLSAWFEQGWPWPCTSCEYSDKTGGTWGLLINESVKANLGGAAGPIPRAFGWRPIWPGAAYNVAIFASAWWMLLFMPSMLRRLVRRRRGRCIACGYDLRATTTERCPECGAAKANPAAPAACDK